MQWNRAIVSQMCRCSGSGIKEDAAKRAPSDKLERTFDTDKRESRKRMSYFIKTFAHMFGYSNYNE